MERYSHMVESIKGNNAEVFREVYFVLNSHETKQPIRQLPAKTSEKFKPDLEMRPAPLVFNCNIVEMHRFNDQFVKYIKSGSQTPPEGIVYAQACVNIDKFWLNEMKNLAQRGSNTGHFVWLSLLVGLLFIILLSSLFFSFGMAY